MRQIWKSVGIRCSNDEEDAPLEWRAASRYRPRGVREYSVEAIIRWERTTR